MYHYLICCKLIFDLQINNKLHILNLYYYKLIFQNFLKFYFETKLLYLYVQKRFASYINIHLHKYNLHVV
jgi:hypothetical protein